MQRKPHAGRGSETESRPDGAVCRVGTDTRRPPPSRRFFELPCTRGSDFKQIGLTERDVYNTD